MINNATILITGIAGFTGSYISDVLKNRGNRVIGLGVDAGSSQNNYECDLRDESKLAEIIQAEKPDYAIHLAALSFVAEKEAVPFYDVNVIGTDNLLRALANVKTKKVIVASSANVYGVPVKDTPINESQTPAPVNHYSASKLAMECIARTWQSQLPIILTRPFNYTGHGQHERFLVPKIISHFLQRKSIIELGNLDVSRDFTSVGDLVRAYTMLLDSDISNETINICSGIPVSLQEIIDKLIALSGHSIEVVSRKEFSRANEIKTLVGDNSKLKHLLSWDVTETMDDILSSMLEPRSD